MIATQVKYVLVLIAIGFSPLYMAYLSPQQRQPIGRASLVIGLGIVGFSIVFGSPFIGIVGLVMLAGGIVTIVHSPTSKRSRSQ